jgi:integrase
MKCSFSKGENMISADKVLSEQQLSKLLKTLRVGKEKSLSAIQDSSKRSPSEVRVIMDYFLFSIISNTGLRVSEALNLKWTDIHEDFLVIQPEHSKNGKKGSVYYGVKTKILFDELRRLKTTTLKRTNTDLVFSFSGVVPSRSYMHTRFKYWLRVADLPNELSIHSLRHTYGTLCLDKGLTLTFVRDNLRHSNISITSQYLHLTRESRNKVKDLF